MKLCMFHPVDHSMERGWVGRIDGEHVIHLAAQTLQAFFTGGGQAREHAVYPLDGVRLLAPVLHPPSVRVFEDEASFEFANPAAIRGPGSEIERRGKPSDTLSQGTLGLHPRLAAVLGAEGEIGGFTVAADWRDAAASVPKDRDFALGLGPVLVTPEELRVEPEAMIVRVDGEERIRAALPRFDWMTARDLAARGTTLYPGDLLLGPPPAKVDGFESGSVVEVELPELGKLRQRVVAGG